jgi:hypothetical protein
VAIVHMHGSTNSPNYSPGLLGTDNIVTSSLPVLPNAATIEEIIALNGYPPWVVRCRYDGLSNATSPAILPLPLPPSVLGYFL